MCILVSISGVYFSEYFMSVFEYVFPFACIILITNICVSPVPVYE